MLDKLYGLIVGGGVGKRMGGPVPKQFLSLKGQPLLAWSLAAFQSCEEVEGIVLVVPEDYVEQEWDRLKKENRDQKLIAVVGGGADRQQSVWKGLQSLPPDTFWVAVHDAARPFVTSQLILATFHLAQNVGAAIPTVPIHDTLIQVDEEGGLLRPIARQHIRRSQTPQVFRAGMLADCHKRAVADGLVFTDDATLVNHYGQAVSSFAHYGENRKITTPQDMEKITMQRLGKASGIRCGQGYDVHAFSDDRPLVLAGIRFPDKRGLAGHSDADVISHALCDALLGAAALGDLGHHFPSNDPAYRDISSLVLLEETAQLVRERGLEIIFVDTTLIGETPHIASRREEMQEKLAVALSIDTDCVSVKATTTEGLGFTGRSEGLAAQALATLQVMDQEELK